MDRKNPRNHKVEQSMENVAHRNLGVRINSPGARRGQTNHQGFAMEHIPSPLESSFGSTSGLRSNVDHETTVYPLELYDALFPTDMGQNLATNQDDHRFVGQTLMGDHARNAYQYSFPAPQHPPIGYPFRGYNYIPADNTFGYPARNVNDGHYSNNFSSAVNNPYSQALQPGSHKIPAGSGHVERTPESSTAPGNVTTGTSSSPILLNTRGSQEPCVSVWDPTGSNAPEGRNRKRRKMTGDELVRNRALKAAGGACNSCRRRKKKCTHKDDRLILSAPTPTSARTRASAQAPVAAPALHSSSDALNVSPQRTRSARPGLDDVPAAVGPQHRHQHNPSVSSYGRTLNASMFSPSEGGASSNGTRTSGVPDATLVALDAPAPRLGGREQIGRDTAGVGDQFIGQPAPEADPMNPENELIVLENWLNGAPEYLDPDRR